MFDVLFDQWLDLFFWDVFAYDAAPLISSVILNTRKRIFIKLIRLLFSTRVIFYFSIWPTMVVYNSSKSHWKWTRIGDERSLTALFVTPPSHRPGRIFSASWGKTQWGSISSYNCFDWGFEFNCFQVRKFSEDKKDNTLFCNEGLFISSFSAGTKFGVYFSTVEDIFANFSSGKGSQWVCEKGV